jgi:pimeloyl-ACP methyl ester carboxylesterase
VPFDPSVRIHDVKTNGISLRVHEMGEGVPVVLLHGFPELADSWRHQLPALAEAGYRAIAPDMRGYGGSSRPEAIEAYAVDELARDVAKLIAALGEERAVVIGHDWGSPVAWHTALRHPERVHAVGSLSVPYSQRRPDDPPPLEGMRALAGPDHIFYIDYFQEPGVADAELAADVRFSLAAFLWSISGDAPRDARFQPIRRGARFIDSITMPAALPPWLGEDDLQVYVDQVYVDAFERTGFTGGLNWYRNVTRNWERSADLAGAVVQQPALFITGSPDPARNPGGMARLPETVRDLRVNEVLDGCGHWTQQERPDEVNRLLLRFLREVVA